MSTGFLALKQQKAMHKQNHRVNSVKPNISGEYKVKPNISGEYKGD